MKSKAFLFFLFLPLFIFSQSESEKRLLDKITELEKSTHLKHASWSFSVKNLSKNVYLLKHQSQLSLTPASTLKLLTTATALEILGKGYQYETKLFYTGKLDTVSGILDGDIIIKGGGDPSLRSSYFEHQKDNFLVLNEWVDLIINQLHIKKIQGAIIADASAFENEMIPSNWIWGDIGNYYGAGASGLSFMDNMYYLHFRTGRAGTKASILSTNPEIPGLTFSSEVIANGNSDNAYIFGAPYNYERTVTGSIPPYKSKFSIKGSIPDPAWFCAYSLTKNLKEKGVVIQEEANTFRLIQKETDQKTLIHTFKSPTLDSIIYFTNLKSNNLFAEHLLKTLSMHKYGQGTLSAGINELESFWKSKGMDLSGLNIADGSGLSRSNSITTQQQVEVLANMAGSENFEAFYNSLPVAGKTGSLSNMCKGSKAENNLRAKSGYISRVRGYTGYVKNTKGDLLAFSMLANNYACTAAQMKNLFEELMVLLAELD